MWRLRSNLKLQKNKIEMNIFFKSVYTISNPKMNYPPKEIFGLHAKDTINTLSSPNRKAAI